MGKIKDINSIPTWETKCFGVEIEFVHKPENSRLSNRDIALEIRRKACHLIQEYNDIKNTEITPVKIYGESYNHATQDYWKIVGDATAQPTQRQTLDGYLVDMN